MNKVYVSSRDIPKQCDGCVFSHNSCSDTAKTVVCNLINKPVAQGPISETLKDKYAKCIVYPIEAYERAIRDEYVDNKDILGEFQDEYCE